ncbi:MAG: DUF4293 domain-containing protein [Paludibacteraceae bacterium]
MIQRVQTLYLLAVVVLGILLCCFAPVQFLPAEGVEYILLMPFAKWPMAVMSVAIPAIALVNIFLFKHRMVQARLNVVNVVLCIGYYALLALYIAFVVRGYETVNNEQLTGAAWYLNVWAGIPLVCIVLNMMATRRILKDEALVRAADRIR